MNTSTITLKKKYGFENPFLPDPLAKKALRYLKKGRRLLDAGCGEGADSVYFAENGFQVTAMDSNKIYLNRLRVFKRDNNCDNISVKYGDVINHHYRKKMR